MKKITYLFAFIFISLTAFSQTNMLQNGSIEDAIDPSTRQAFFGKSLVTPLLSTGFFTQSYFHPVTDIPVGTWYKRGTSQHQCRIHVDTVRARTGDKSMIVCNAGGNTSNATATIPWYHNLAQKVKLDDTKKYEFKFYLQADSIYTAYSGFQSKNNISKIAAGIVSSNNATQATNYTYMEYIDIPATEEWEEYVLTFDLPAIIEAEALKGKTVSFDSCAVFIALQTSWDAEAGKTKFAIFYVDDLSLTEKLPTSNEAINSTKNKISIKDKTVAIDGQFNRISIYNLSGMPIYRSSGNNNSVSCTLNTGIYIVNVDGKTTKIIVK